MHAHTSRAAARVDHTLAAYRRNPAQRSALARRVRRFKQRKARAPAYVRRGRPKGAPPLPVRDIVTDNIMYLSEGYFSSKAIAERRASATSVRDARIATIQRERRRTDEAREVQLAEAELAEARAGIEKERRLVVLKRRRRVKLWLRAVSLAAWAHRMESLGHYCVDRGREERQRQQAAHKIQRAWRLRVFLKKQAHISASVRLVRRLVAQHLFRRRLMRSVPRRDGANIILTFYREHRHGLLRHVVHSFLRRLRYAQNMWRDVRTISEARLVALRIRWDEIFQRRAAAIVDEHLRGQERDRTARTKELDVTATTSRSPQQAGTPRVWANDQFVGSPMSSFSVLPSGWTMCTPRSPISPQRPSTMKRASSRRMQATRSFRGSRASGEAVAALQKLQTQRSQLLAKHPLQLIDTPEGAAIAGGARDRALRNALRRARYDFKTRVIREETVKRVKEIAEAMKLGTLDAAKVVRSTERGMLAMAEKKFHDADRRLRSTPPPVFLMWRYLTRARLEAIVSAELPVLIAELLELQQASAAAQEDLGSSLRHHISIRARKDAEALATEAAQGSPRMQRELGHILGRDALRVPLDSPRSASGVAVSIRSRLPKGMQPSKGSPTVSGDSARSVRADDARGPDTLERTRRQHSQHFDVDAIDAAAHHARQQKPEVEAPSSHHKWRSRPESARAVRRTGTFTRRAQRIVDKPMTAR